METIAYFSELFLESLSYWWVIIPSILLGFVVGAIPGFSAANTIIILLPFTLVMDVEVGLMFMVALYCASRMGAGIPAILVNIPGTAGAAATPLDGYPMVKNGFGQQALAIGLEQRALDVQRVAGAEFPQIAGLAGDRGAALALIAHVADAHAVVVHQRQGGVGEAGVVARHREVLGHVDVVDGDGAAVALDPATHGLRSPDSCDRPGRRYRS